MLRIAVDVMGGDVGVSATIPAVALALQADADVHMVLVGNPEVIEPLLVRVPATLRERISLHAASEVVGMDELPSKALRLKKDSSMRVALDLVKSGQAQAMVSAGNTGALMATAKFVLKTLPKIDRPAIVTALPSMRPTGHVHLLDLGANAECTAEQLVQFAVMGAAMVSALEGITQPRVALLNIGSEEIKGNDVIRAAAQQLQAMPINYVGYIEGDGIFHADVDVVVADGFVGNVALKTGEGVAKLITALMKEAFCATPSPSSVRCWSSRSWRDLPSVSTPACTTVPACWGCAAWSSSRTAVPMRWRLPMRCRWRCARHVSTCPSASPRFGPKPSCRHLTPDAVCAALFVDHQLSNRLIASHDASCPLSKQSCHANPRGDHWRRFRRSGHGPLPQAGGL